MKTMFRDLLVSFVVSFAYVLFSNTVESTVVACIISLGVAGMFSLCSEIIRAVVRECLSMNNTTEEQIKKGMQMGAVVRDSVFAFIIVYGFMTNGLGSALTIGQTIGYLVAALAPALVIAVISREIRVPFLTEYRKYDAVIRDMGFKKVA